MNNLISVSDLPVPLLCLHVHQTSVMQKYFQVALILESKKLKCMDKINQKPVLMYVNFN